MSGLNPVRLDGCLFLPGPDEDKEIKVSGGQEFALALCRIIDRGHVAFDQKDQGLGGVNVFYKSGKVDLVEIGKTGLIRVKGRVPIQTDLSELMPLLKRLVKEASTGSPGTGK